MSAYTFKRIAGGMGTNPAVATVNTDGRNIGWIRADGKFTPAHTDYFHLEDEIVAAYQTVKF